MQFPTGCTGTTGLTGFLTGSGPTGCTGTTGLIGFTGFLMLFFFNTFSVTLTFHCSCLVLIWKFLILMFAGAVGFLR
ncbi:MAG: hypothetical protein F8N15_03910 [Methanobacterium sp.]|nr:hypothetical protein [Methanobacterium sp.]